LLTKTNNRPIRPMPIVKWPIPIVGKLADYRPIIGAPLVMYTLFIQTNKNWSNSEWKSEKWVADQPTNGHFMPQQC